MDIELQIPFWGVMINTWFVMAVLVLGSWWVTRDLKVEGPVSLRQHALETIVEAIDGQIAEVAGGDESAPSYTPFVGTIFLFLAAGAVLGIIPPIGSWISPGTAWSAFYQPPASALETAASLALCVFVAVPFYSIWRRGLRHWLSTYIEPTPFMLPFNLIGDVSRVLALAVRLFGNMMSGTVLGALLLVIAPIFIPALMNLFGMLMGVLQAYIFAILAMVYIASAVQVDKQRSAAERWKRKAA